MDAEPALWDVKKRGHVWCVAKTTGHAAVQNPLFTLISTGQPPKASSLNQNSGLPFPTAESDLLSSLLGHTVLLVPIIK